MGPNGDKHFKALLILQIAAKSLQTSPELSSQWSSQNYIGKFSNVKIQILTIFFLLACGSMGVNISKRYTSCKSQATVCKLLLNFPPCGPYKLLWGL